MVRVLIFLIASLVIITSAKSTDRSPIGSPALEAKLHRTWISGPCVGEMTLRADGTFERRQYSPGNNHLTGTWEVRWNSLPPNLVRTFTSSDDPDQNGVGKTWEVKLIELNDDDLVYQYPEQFPDGHRLKYTRANK
ncbi:MAG: hypothetical protein SGI77_03625 [Pirellulaceae bacterium]|nr:hypothetical protein [Pirellulaceae bacterium]